MDSNNRIEISADAPQRRWLAVIGIISIIFGVLALLFPWWATLAIELVFGAFLLTVGILELVRILFDRPLDGVAPSVVFGILAILTGALLLVYPLQGMFTLTLVLAIFFLLGGLFKTASALTLRPARGWGWLLTSGIVSIVLGIVVLAALPASALWLLGILFGIDLILFGIAQVIFATATRQILRSGAI